MVKGQSMQQVVLVDTDNVKVGLAEKLAAHRRPAKLHRAISVVLYRKRHVTRSAGSGQAGDRRQAEKVEILMQKRSGKKPLWPLYWANTVCTHPKDGESNLACAVRRLKEEMGVVMKKDDLRELYTFTYQADYNQNLAEREVDMVIVGEYEGGYELNPDEAVEARWVDYEELRKDLKKHADLYAPWPKLIFSNQQLWRSLWE